MISYSSITSDFKKLQKHHPNVKSNVMNRNKISISPKAFHGDTKLPITDSVPFKPQSELEA